MVSNADSVKGWRRKTKERIIEAFGGKCGCCGYDKCQAAFDLHHVNPEDKEFSFGQIRANPKSWSKIVIELRKCVLLCANCHREVHAGVREIPKNIQSFNEDFAEYERPKLALDKCPVCGTLKPKRQKTCSRKCAAKLSGKMDWESIDLYDLKINQKLSNKKIADKLGCSDVAVLKRLRKQKIGNYS